MSRPIVLTARGKRVRNGLQTFGVLVGFAIILAPVVLYIARALLIEGALR